MKNLKSRTVSVFMILIVCLGLFIAITPNVQATSWLTGYGYRKSHIVNNATGAGTNYQIKITANYGAGADSGDNVYLNSHSRTDFGDVRFTKSDGTTQYDYWREKYTLSTSALFWVEISDDLSATNITMYIYYGNSSLTTTSNGDNTFILFDTFDGSTINTSRWLNYSTPTLTVSGSELWIQSAGNWRGIYQNTTTYPAIPLNRAMRMRANPISTDAGSYFLYGFTNAGGSFITNASYFVPYGVSSGWNATRTAKAGTWGDAYSTQSSMDAWSTWDILRHTSYSTFLKNDTTTFTNMTTNIPQDNEVINLDVYNNINTPTLKIDWVLTRKWQTPAPVNSTWGSEETPKAWKAVETFTGRLYNYTWYLVESFSGRLYNFSWYLAENWLGNLYNYSWYNAEAWILLLRNQMFIDAESWNGILHTLKWFDSESWIGLLRNPTWFVSELWEGLLRNSTWFFSESWIGLLRNSTFFDVETWSGLLKYLNWWDAETWLGSLRNFAWWSAESWLGLLRNSTFMDAESWQGLLVGRMWFAVETFSGMLYGFVHDYLVYVAIALGVGAIGIAIVYTTNEEKKKKKGE